MSDPSQPNWIASFRPVTFVERGVAVPFTTPMLAGTRARPSPASGGPGASEAGGGAAGRAELLVPNPSGARGVYVIPWNGLQDFCRPTMHDVLLSRQVAGLGAITPRSIAAAAREAAASGTAGREASEAAREADRALERTRMATNFTLLLALLRQAESAAPGSPLPEQDLPERVERRARATIARLAPALGRAPAVIAQDLEAIAGLLAPVGLATELAPGGRFSTGLGGPARLPRILQSLVALEAAALDWVERHDDESAMAARLVSEAAALTARCAHRTIAEAQALALDVVGLLRLWASAPQQIAEIAGRTEWLLDGWEQICLIWDDAALSGTWRSALLEMVLMVPAMPRQLHDWVGVQASETAEFRRQVLLYEDWRTGAAVPRLIARNEKLRAIAA